MKRQAMWFGVIFGGGGGIAGNSPFNFLLSFELLPFSFAAVMFVMKVGVFICVMKV